MRPTLRPFVLPFLVWTGCSPPAVVNEPQVIDLALVSLAPVAVDPARATPLTLTLSNGCAADALEVTIGGLPIRGITETATDVYAFASPVVLVRVPTAVKVVATCSAARDPLLHVYGVKSVETTLTFDPSLELPPEALVGTPTGERVSVRSPVTVTFGGDVDPGTVDPVTVAIEGVSGRVTYVESTRTATLQPDSVLEFGREYAVVVRGVRSRSGVALRSTALNGSTATDGVRWTFRTRPRGEGSPWTRDMPSAGGQVRSGDGAIRLYTSTGALGSSGVLGSTDGTLQIRSGVVATTVPVATP